MAGGQGIEANAALIHAADILDQCIADHRCADTVFNVGIQCGEPVHLKKDLGAETYLLEDRIRLAADEILFR